MVCDSSRIVHVDSDSDINQLLYEANYKIHMKLTVGATLSLSQLITNENHRIAAYMILSEYRFTTKD